MKKETSTRGLYKWKQTCIKKEVGEAARVWKNGNCTYEKSSTKETFGHEKRPIQETFQLSHTPQTWERGCHFDPKSPTKETYGRALQKRPVDMKRDLYERPDDSRTNLRDGIRGSHFDPKRPTKETYERDLQKRPAKETYKRDLSR